MVECDAAAGVVGGKQSAPPGTALPEGHSKLLDFHIYREGWSTSPADLSIMEAGGVAATYITTVFWWYLRLARRSYTVISAVGVRHWW